MAELFDRAVRCWSIIISDPKLRKILNLEIDIEQLAEPVKSKVVKELPVILADQRMDDYMRDPNKLQALEKALEDIRNEQTPDSDSC